MDIRMAAALAGQIPNVAQFCRDHDISRETFYKYQRRFAQLGIDGLQEQSRRPLTSPGQTSAEMEDLIVLRRKQLLEAGCDCGPQSIVWSLQRDGVTGGAVALDGVADPDPAWADHCATAETPEVGDQAFLLRPAQ